MASDLPEHQKLNPNKTAPTKAIAGQSPAVWNEMSVEKAPVLRAEDQWIEQNTSPAVIARPTAMSATPLNLNAIFKAPDFMRYRI